MFKRAILFRYLFLSTLLSISTAFAAPFEVGEVVLYYDSDPKAAVGGLAGGLWGAVVLSSSNEWAKIRLHSGPERIVTDPKSHLAKVIQDPENPVKENVRQSPFGFSVSPIVGWFDATMVGYPGTRAALLGLPSPENKDRLSWISSVWSTSAYNPIVSKYEFYPKGSRTPV